MWTPESVSTGRLSCPTFSLKASSSNGACIWPRPNMPKSPPRLADEQSEYLEARSANVASFATICLRYPFSSSMASSLVRVMFSSLHDDGRLLSACLTRRWLQRISPGSAGASGLSHWDFLVYILRKYVIPVDRLVLISHPSGKGASFSWLDILKYSPHVYWRTNNEKTDGL